MKIKMKSLRQAIRTILLEVNIEKHPVIDTPGINWKRQFREEADQESLQKLAYIHWCTLREAETILKASGKDEISTAIHSRTGNLIPWKHDEDDDEITVGVELKGWVTFAANMDLQSGRLSGIADMPFDMLHPWDQWKKNTSGFAKRPHTLGYDEVSGGANTELPNKGFIYKAEDLVVRDEYADSQWPEAILDNWKVVKIWHPPFPDPRPRWWKWVFNPLNKLVDEQGIEFVPISDWPG